MFESRCRAASCRSCGHKGLEPVLDLGSMPLSDGLLTREQLSAPEGKYPLDVGFCRACTLVQILETVPPEVLFGHDYPYFSSFSDHLLKHSRDNALNLIKTRGLGPTSLAVELASNDGYLLKNFVEHGVPVLGIDPAPGPAKAAEKIGVPTRNTFFTKDLAAQLVAEGKRADVVIGNNVLAHVADTNGFVQGVAMLLKDEGTTSIEVPYLRDLIEHCEFDTIYHEHLCYFSALALDSLFRRNGLFLNHVERIPIHGGSLRLYAGRKENVQGSVISLLAEERSLSMDKPAYYRDFGARVRAIGDTMRTMLKGFKKEGRSIAGYGAAAKGAIMLNYVGAGTDLIDFVADRNVHKQGKFMPGVHVPIVSPDEIMKRRPDYLVLLPWNFKDEILRQQDAYRKAGGKFIIPIPTPTVV
ncbi:MAG: class I SAM-dependent methyltransferase [Phycisphaeraceae bacterium]|nr:class I SAM-dependent methyltransferase [Phycisphaeraceae bacterium]